MKAIVLTYDRNRAITEHMIFTYEKLWPDHPFHFRIPYQELITISPHKVEYVKSSQSIKETILNLLSDVEDEEWIYWCIDDKYPIAFNLERVKALYRWIQEIGQLDISGILFCRCRNLLEDKYLTGERIIDKHGNIYLERKGYEQIWLHQFLRVKVLRHLFLNFPDEISTAKEMDYLLMRMIKPSSHCLFVSEKNLAIFGESTYEGYLTLNLCESLVQNNLRFPEWFNGFYINYREIIGELKK